MGFKLDHTKIYYYFFFHPLRKNLLSVKFSHLFWTFFLSLERPCFFDADDVKAKRVSLYSYVDVLKEFGVCNCKLYTHHY